MEWNGTQWNNIVTLWFRKILTYLIRRFIVHLCGAHVLRSLLPFHRCGIRLSCLPVWFGSIFSRLIILYLNICYLSFLPFPFRALFVIFRSLWFGACACIYLGRFNRLYHIWRCQYEYWVVLSGRQPDKCHMSTWDGNVHWHSNLCDGIEMVGIVDAPIFDV